MGQEESIEIGCADFNRCWGMVDKNGLGVDKKQCQEVLNLLGIKGSKKIVKRFYKTGLERYSASVFRRMLDVKNVKLTQSLNIQLEEMGKVGNPTLIKYTGAEKVQNNTFLEVLVVYCQSCGCKMKETEQFCSYCGCKLQKQSNILAMERNLLDLEIPFNLSSVTREKKDSFFANYQIDFFQFPKDLRFFMMRFFSVRTLLCFERTCHQALEEVGRSECWRFHCILSNIGSFDPYKSWKHQCLSQLRYQAFEDCDKLQRQAESVMVKLPAHNPGQERFFTYPEDFEVAQLRGRKFEVFLSEKKLLRECFAFFQLAKYTDCVRACVFIGTLPEYYNVFLMEPLDDDWVCLVDLLAKSSELLGNDGKPKFRPFSYSSICGILEQLAFVLEVTIAFGILYLDVKSDNVMVNRKSGKIKLLPTQFCKIKSDANQMFNEVIGTPYWMPPELIRGHDYDGSKAIMWEFGVVLFEFIYGEPPYMEFPPLRALFLITTKGLPPFQNSTSHPVENFEELEKLFNLCTQKDPKERPTFRALLTDSILRSKSSNKGYANILAAEIAMLERLHKEQEQTKKN